MTEEPTYSPPERSRLQLLWWDISTAVTLWLIRHRLRRCPMCKGARMIHHFADDEGYAELRRCWTCTGDDRYLAATKIPAVQVVGGGEPEPTPPRLRAVE